ncbi:MAG: DUF1275 domain-containing protein [Solobacterium sp.]|nr:DUF1275 domain-containing protein [Solobacterium sp.]
MTKEIKATETIGFAMLVSVVGGMMDGYSYIVRGGVFANGQTGNFLKLAIGLAEMDTEKMLRSIIPIIGFWIGIFTAHHIQTKIIQKDPESIHDDRWKIWVLVLEMVLLFIVGFVPDSVLHLVPNTLISFTASMQYCTFRYLNGSMGYSSVFASGNMRSTAEQYYNWLVLRQDANRPKALQYSSIMASFFLGALVVALLARFLQEKAIWIASVLLLAGILRVMNALRSQQ